MKIKRLVSVGAAALLLWLAARPCLSAPVAGGDGGWTLQQCVDYALAHNIRLRKDRAAVESAEVTLREARAGLLPSLNASVSQALNYRPFQESGGSYVNAGLATQGRDKATQSGSYGINASWTVWDAGKRKMTVSNSELSLEAARLSADETANDIQEQIAALYVQILYMEEAVCVNEALLAQDSIVLARGEEMVRQGQMSQADLAQLTAQVSSGRYDVTNVRTQIANAKMQMRQLLELPHDTIFDVAPAEADEARLLQALPGRDEVYAAALGHRPEIRNGELSVRQAGLATRMARTAALPTISLTGGLGDSHVTGTADKFGAQLKSNFNANIGLSVSIPIFDNRKARSDVERARVGEVTAALDLVDAQRTLYNSVETYWLNAVNYRGKYLAARDNVAALQTSYDLLQEQFRLGLKNIADLLDSRARLLTARQDLLQDKYTALLNRSLLEFYGTGMMAY